MIKNVGNRGNSSKVKPTNIFRGMECRKEIWDITKVQIVLLRIEERLIWTFSVILPMAAFADAITLKLYIKPASLTPLTANHLICRQGLIKLLLDFSDRGQAWRLPSNIY